MIVDCLWQRHWGMSVDDHLGIHDIRDCAHNMGYDCDHLFHYCRYCSVPLDDCGCNGR